MNENVLNERLIDTESKNSIRAPQGRYFSLVSYLSKEQIAKVLEHYKGYIDSALYILHDKDFKQTEQDSGHLNADDLAKLAEHCEGKELKEKHWHILIKFYTSRTEAAVRKYFYRFRFSEVKEDDDGKQSEILINTHVQMVDDLVSIRDYLTHEDDPDKHHYSKDEVYQFGRGWECFNAVGYSADSVMDIVDRLNHGASLRRMAREYGRDFVYHFKHYSEFARAVTSQEQRAQEYLDLWNQAVELNCLTITATDYDGNERKITLDPRKYNQAVDIVTAFEQDFHLYYLGD